VSGVADEPVDGRMAPPLAELVNGVPQVSVRSGDRRYLLGVAGPPGGGKSTLSASLLSALIKRDGEETWQLVQLDGFHLSNEVLISLDRRARKGAPDTFDVAGFVALLDRITADEPNETVYAPRFHRAIEEAVAASTAIGPKARGVIVEGNYLFLDDGEWANVRPRLNDCWFVDSPSEEERTERLVARASITYGSRKAGEQWVESSDQKNVRLVIDSRPRDVPIITSG
jgi:pantothenate kinase